MSRLDEIERAIARASWATDDAIYFSSETRDDILALVAVARAAQRLQRMDTSIEDDIDAIDAALAPLLEEAPAA